MASKFEQKFGKYAIKNLTIYLIAGYVLGYLIYFINKDFYAMLTFNPYQILHGQVWRLVTWIITMPESLGIFTIIMLFLYYSLGRTLDRTWGSYRYNVYLFSGFLFTIVGAFILYFILMASGMPIMVQGQALQGANRAVAMGQVIGMYVTTYYINTSIFLAFAATYPDQELLLYFIIPIKIKWLGLVYIVFMGIDVVRTFTSEGIISGILVLAMIIFSLLNFLIYFFFTRKKMGIGGVTFQQRKKKVQYKQRVKQADVHNTYKNGARHKCAICGRTDLDNPNLTFRFCSKCSGNKEYCEDHLFTHEHN
ncbi:MAG: hypothetical protein K6E58_06545 [Eubacterium sp.]|nr:hypothetical protein [Eubacterium sp.]